MRKFELSIPWWLENRVFWLVVLSGEISAKVVQGVPRTAHWDPAFRVVAALQERMESCLERFPSKRELLVLSCLWPSPFSL